MIKNQRTTAIIVAAGSGVRFGQDKMLIELNGKTVFARSVSAFLLPFIDEIIIVCQAKKRPIYEDILRQSSIQDPRLKFIAGGDERWQSSLKGIQAATGELVAIHDGARPLIKAELIEKSFFAAAQAGAALVAAPATDSIKLVDEKLANFDAIDRQKIWLAQTPQTFKKDLILAAYAAAQASGYQQMTDESELVTKFLHQKVTVVKSDSTNLKITYPFDLQVAEILSRML
ncbi:MAG: 2-C-methyl-D-erythritol 4-phosphate cytidylyltransferase [bacterium]|nr:2-C-methyl-D-erythritol 4-phosphate cytidylyltransferase [bacterium]